MSESSYESESSSDEEPNHSRLKSSVSVKRSDRDRIPRTPSVSSEDEKPAKASRSRHYSEEDGELTPDMEDSDDDDDDELNEVKREWRRESSHKTKHRKHERDRSSEEEEEDRDERRHNKRRSHRDSDERYSKRRHDDYERDLEIEKRRQRREERHREQSEERKKVREDRHKLREEDEKKRRNNDREDGERVGHKRKHDEVSEGNTGEGGDEDEAKKFLAEKRARQENNIMTKTGGAYIPPARLRMMQANITDKKSEQFQRIAWEALKKSINGLINKVNIANIVMIVRELFQENIVRGRGVLARSIIQAQAASPTFTHVYAAFVAIINTKFPQNGELMLKRLILSFKKAFKRNDKPICLSASKFIAHLVNQQVAHEIVALETLTLLLENPTNDSVEVAVGFLKDSGAKLTEVSPRGAHAIFERMRNVLHEGSVDTRTQYMIEVMFAVRKDGFKDHPSVLPELDLVEEEDQFTHMLTLDDAVNAQDILNVFKFDAEYEESEEKYKVLKREILGEDSSDSEGSDDGSGSSDSESDESGEENGEEKPQLIIDKTETNMIAFRRTVYLTIQSSLDFEECCHKLLKTNIPPGMESELTNMILDCCAQQRTYEKFFGLLAQRFCMINKIYVIPFQAMFKEQYETCHRLETNKLRNAAKFFGHLLHSDALSWEVLQCIHLNEDETSSSSRIFIKILFQELSEYMGLPKLNNRLNDATLQPYFEGLFPRDNPRNTRFAINFFTSIGLGSLTVELRNHLKTMPKPKPAVPQLAAEESSSSSDSSSDSSDSSDDSSSDSDSSSSSSSEDERSKKSKKKKVPTATLR